MRVQVPSSRIEIVTTGAHLPNVENTPRFAKAIAPFLGLAAG
jgi:pimeloyl-ACP methyl ester carboxylesterase